jgi:DNA primase large subunit
MINLEDLRTRYLLNGDELHNKLHSLLQATHMHCNTEQQMEDDLLSHWILALSFAANEESRRRFVQFEMDVFKHRVQQLSPPELQDFIQLQQKYEQVTQEERDVLAAEDNPLEDVFRATQAFGLTPLALSQLFAKTLFYKVNFTKVIDLVRTRRVYLLQGKAYVPQSELISALASEFKLKLMDKLNIASRSLLWVTKDERMGPLITKLQLASLHKQGLDLALVQAGAVTLDALPSLAKRSFPLCARELELALTTPTIRRFMNDSRQQYMLFLKGIGLSMEDSIAYFQQEFQRKGMTPDEYKKKGHTYQVMHNYGKAGKQANYPPWSCVKTIATSRTTGEHTHGCTFKELPQDKLGQMVVNSGVTDPGAVKKIQELAKQGSFQLACRMHWELLHVGGNSELVGNHPNAWFDASMKFWQEKEKKPTANAFEAGSVKVASSAEE